MQAVVPVLRITNYDRSKAFYVDSLGFQIDWEHHFEPHLPVFMQLTRDEMTIDLTQHSGDCPPGGLVLFYVPDVDAWYEEFKSRSVSVHEPPNESLQGLRDMTVIDPDGNKLRFCTRLKEWRR
jgi:catechol 2,3-dioxygenase-like lactoylglutathione lyase family enzyme